MSEGNKVEIVRLHNELRANVANGQFRGGAVSFPPASDMMQLTWDNEVFNNFTICNVIFVRLGVSICLDVISIEISISTPKKYQSRRSRKSRRFSKVSLDVMDNLGRDQDFSILSR